MSVVSPVTWRVQTGTRHPLTLRFVEIELVASSGAPVAGQECEVVAPDGWRCRATTDAQGRVRTWAPAGVELRVSFSKLDGDLWRPIGSAPEAANIEGSPRAASSNAPTRAETAAVGSAAGDPATGAAGTTVEQEEPDQVVVQLGVFFDGTGNRYDVDRACAEDDNEPTNVAKLFELYGVGGQERLYLEGVGTNDEVPECSVEAKAHEGLSAKVGQAFGAGIRNRLGRAHSELQRFAREQKKQAGDRPVLIQLDLFGFSRGAATARFFANEVKAQLGGTSEWNYAPWPPVYEWTEYLPKGVEVQLRFAGLFDTVGSVGRAGDDSEAGYNKHLHADDFGRVVHLTAFDEKREYFPLTSVLDGPGAGPDNFVEEVLPGAHSDVGGGYGGEQVTRRIYLERQRCWSGLEAKEKALRARWADTLRGKGGEVDIERVRLPKTSRRRSVEHVLYAVWVRNVKKDLSFYALERMHTLALEHDIPLRELSHLSTLQAPMDYLISTELRRLVEEYLDNGSKAAKLALDREYVHHSHQLVKRPKASVHAHKMEKDPDLAAPNGVREVFYNRQSRAEPWS